ncbi:MAG: phosphoribosylanthranilate isomerase [Pseudomonadota bacterium]
MTQVKICGVKTPEAISAAASAGARFIGFVFAPRSPRLLAAEQAAILVRGVPTGVKIVGLFVNPTDEDLAFIWGRVPIDMIQLHGDETPARVLDIKARLGVPIIKAIPVASPHDLDSVPSYEQVADWLLFDAKAAPSKQAEGGNGLAFDWGLLAGQKFQKPWMLAGGLHPENIITALSILNPDAVDVSSGVESSVGIKDPAKIKAFISLVKSRE